MVQRWGEACEVSDNDGGVLAKRRGRGSEPTGDAAVAATTRATMEVTGDGPGQRSAAGPSP